MIFPVGFFNSTGFIFEPEYQALINRATFLGFGLPTYSQQVRQNLVVFLLKRYGIWNKIDVLYFLGNNGSAAFGTLNVKNPLMFQATLVNAPLWDSNFGFKGDGISAYIRTNFNPSLGGVNYTLDNAGLFAYLTETPSGSAAQRVISGVQSSSQVIFVARSGSPIVRINHTGDLNADVNLEGLGYKALNRINSLDVVLFNDLVREDRTASSLDALPNAPHTLFNRANVQFGNTRLGIWGAGSNLVNENTNLRNIITNYMAPYL